MIASDNCWRRVADNQRQAGLDARRSEEQLQEIPLAVATDALRASAWRLNTSPRYRLAFARDLEDVAKAVRFSEARPIREAAAGLLDFAERAGRRRSRQWIREGARDHAVALLHLLETEQEETSMAKTQPTVRKPAKKAPKKATEPPRSLKKATKAPARTAKAAATKKAPATPARGHATPSLWALAAFVEANALAERRQKAWEGYGCEAGRLLAMRVEGVNAHPADETYKIRPRPSGFTTWANLAAKLREVVIGHQPVPVGTRSVSPYALELATEEGHPLYDPRVTNPLKAESIESIDTFGVLDAIKAKELDGLFVADGRQRLRVVYAVNERRISRWFNAASRTGKADAPPVLITEVPIQVLTGSVADAQRLGGVLNAEALRQIDNLRDQAHRAFALKKSGSTREDIATALAVSVSTVTNLLALQQLAPSLKTVLYSGVLPPALAYLLATQPEDHQDELWVLVQRVAPPRRRDHLRALITAEAKVAELRQALEGAVSIHPTTLEVDRKNLARAEEELEALRAAKSEAPSRPRKGKELEAALRSLQGLKGEGPRLVAAVLAFANGGSSLEELFEMIQTSTATVVEPLGVECNSCCAEPGVECYTDQEIDEEGEPGDAVNGPGEFHRVRREEAERLSKAKAAEATHAA
jgi:hypothetical protein